MAYKYLSEVRNEYNHYQQNPAASTPEKIKVLQKKLDFIGQFSLKFKNDLPKLSLNPSLQSDGSLSKAEAIVKVLKSNRATAEWYQSELGVSASDFNDSNVDSSIANQIVEEGLLNGVIKPASTPNRYLPGK